MKRSFSRITGAIGFLSFCSLLHTSAFAQTSSPSSTTGSNLNGQPLNTVTTAVPFLNFTPDARSGGLGDAGGALRDADANAIFWNPSKLVFAEKSAGASISYTPWLRDLIGDMYYTYITGYKKVGKNQVFGASLMYFDLGTIEFTTSQGLSSGTFNSREYAFTASYSRQLSKNFSMGLNLRYLNSNLAGAYNLNGTQIKPGGTAAADISAYYQTEVRDEVTGKGLGWTFGGMISNIGGKISYGSPERYFIPTNLRLGGSVTYYSDLFNKFNFVLDLNKLMVPTPPVNPNQSPVASIFASFADAPGGFSEELKEINVATGVEYWYNNQFAVRVGYHGESKLKGGRNYFTAGIGLRLQERYGIDFSYVMPTGRQSPLSNTFRISLLIDLTKSARAAAEDDADEADDTNN